MQVVWVSMSGRFCLKYPKVRKSYKGFFYIYVSSSHLFASPLTFLVTESLLLNRMLSALGLVVAFGVAALVLPNNGGPGPNPDPVAIPINGRVSLSLAGMRDPWHQIPACTTQKP